jgi:predicted pyridoxine 5'-phosphate oxidase superfamily flavin-nucleotide-binding protein
MSIARPGQALPPCVIVSGRSGGLAVFAVPRSAGLMHGPRVTSRLPGQRRLRPRRRNSPPPIRIRRRAERRPGSEGEHRLQDACGTRDRAERFYNDQFCDRLLPRMVEFVHRMEMVFIATADAGGDCDASLRAGSPGFLRVLDDRTLAYPEYRGNGVMASLGNLSENPHIGLLMIDFVEDLIGLHVNGRAHVLDTETFATRYPGHGEQAEGRRVERWVVVDVVEAYIHCRKHIPRMQRLPQKRAWGTDDPARKGGDYFRARTPAAPPAGAIPAPRAPLDAQRVSGVPVPAPARDPR